MPWAIVKSERKPEELGKSKSKSSRKMRETRIRNQTAARREKKRNRTRK